MEHNSEEALTIETIVDYISNGEVNKIALRILDDVQLNRTVIPMINNITKDKNDAYTVLHDGIIAFIGKISMGETEIENWRGYITNTCRNIAFKHYGRERRYNSLLNKTVEKHHVPEHQTEGVNNEEYLILAIEKLAAATKMDCERILLMRYYHGMSHKEISEKLNVLESSSRNKLDRCLKKIRMEYKKIPRLQDYIKDLLKN